ncbi:DUF6188 family protein [Paenarthrobacter aurescens]|uniref:Uncharacterized protein n=1 Tax=Paenarthrobacter aurescens TaxID=43663 RepID=A0A4Y3NCC6_PAEAU|nr:DUF6188 family protein [Paenarthrobacter aurescens]MDO6146574.1 DUF6188 family protein [Paenarthrobacter aurescens]MDO6157819.1 DUF6188 family protein [Paenarthrobacter aurescens]MDO6161804.1 DUF6188 family protein [Paenarthrobacter aurescens]GEB18873.1 hypothetical protein AAU01_16280 [Paenarthrobacter aurescens]
MNKPTGDRPPLRTWPTAPDTIVRCLVDYGFSIETAGGFLLRIGSEFSFKTSNGVRHELDPAKEPAFLGPALSIARTTLTAGFANDAGALHVEFANGSEIDVPANDRYEA